MILVMVMIVMMVTITNHNKQAKLNVTNNSDTK